MDNMFHQRTVSARPWTLPTFYNGQYQLAYPIQVRTGGGSAVLTSSAGSSYTGSTGPGHSTPTGTLPNNTGAVATPEASSGMSTGVKAGNGVGAAIGGLLLVAFPVYFVLRHKYQQKRGRITPPLSNKSGDIQEIQGKGLQSNFNEIAGDEVYRRELDGTTHPRIVHELD